MNKTNQILERILFSLILLFPITFFLRSLILNFFIILVSLIFIIISINKRYNFFKFDYNKILLLFFSYFFISQLFISLDIEKLIKTFFLLKFFLLFNATIYTFTYIKKDYLKKLLIFLFSFMIFFIIDLYVQYFLNFNIFGLEPSFCDAKTLKCLRYSGLFGSELVAGGYISLVVTSIFILANTIYKNEFLKIIPLILLLTVYITGERTALVVMLIFNIFYYSRFLKFKLSNIIFGVLIVSFFFIFTKESSRYRYSSDIMNLVKNDNNLSLIDSIKTTPWGLHYGASLLMIKDKPLFGNGYKSFKKNCKNYEYLNTRIKNRHHVCSSHPHNYHLEILVDTGIIGYSLFLIFIYFVILNFFSIKIIRENKLFFIMFFYLVILLFLPRPTGSIVSTFFGAMLWYSFGLILGSVNLMNYISKNKVI